MLVALTPYIPVYVRVTELLDPGDIEAASRSIAQFRRLQRAHSARCLHRKRPAFHFPASKNSPPSARADDQTRRARPISALRSACMLITWTRTMKQQGEHALNAPPRVPLNDRCQVRTAFVWKSALRIPYSRYSRRAAIMYSYRS